MTDDELIQLDESLRRDADALLDGKDLQ